MIRNYLKTALRLIGKHPLFTVINVLGLAMGFCSCLVIYLVSSYELSFDTFHPDKERIFRVSSSSKNNDFSDGDVPAPAPAAFRKEITGIETVTGYFPYYNPGITIPQLSQSVRKLEENLDKVIITDPEYFVVFKYDWLAGNPSTSLNEPFRLVLSQRRAKKYFGDIPLASMIGKEVIYDDSLRVTVSGIVKDWKGNTDFPFTDFISFNTIQASFLKNSRHLNDWAMMKGMGQYLWPVCFVKLSKGAAVARVNTQLKSLVNSHIDKESAKSFNLFLQPLADIHFNNSYSQDNIRKAHLPTLYALMAIALFILIIAAINFINLSTAQSMQRAKEIGIRKVLGSSRTSLVVQFLAETLILCLAAITLAVLLVQPILQLFRDFIPSGVRFNVLDPYAFLFIIAITLITSLLAGFYPARMAATYLPATSLKGSGLQKGSEKWLLRKGLIVFQFSISLIFIIGTLVIGKQIRYMLHTDFGLKTDAVVTLDNWSWQDDMGKAGVLREKLSQLPGIQQVIPQAVAPMGWGAWSTAIKYKGRQEISLNVMSDWGNENFISFYGMKILAGRNIMAGDSLTELVINETCARALGFTTTQAALGKFLYFGDNPIPVVGIVADFHQGSFRDAIKPLVIGHQPAMEKSTAIKLSSKGNDAYAIKPVLASIEKIWKTIYPEKEFNYSFMDEAIATFYEKEQKTMKLSQTAMAMTIFISCMGLFGLIMFTAEKKAKEIGIRKVLGAGVADITFLLTKDFLALVLIALLIATPISWILMNGWLQNFSYRITINGWIIIGAGLAAMLIAIATISFQAIKAAMANPVDNLRTE